MYQHTASCCCPANVTKTQTQQDNITQSRVESCQDLTSARRGRDGSLSPVPTHCSCCCLHDPTKQTKDLRHDKTQNSRAKSGCSCCCPPLSQPAAPLLAVSTAGWHYPWAVTTAEAGHVWGTVAAEGGNHSNTGRIWQHGAEYTGSTICKHSQPKLHQGLCWGIICDGPEQVCWWGCMLQTILDDM